MPVLGDGIQYLVPVLGIVLNLVLCVGTQCQYFVSVLGASTWYSTGFGVGTLCRRAARGRYWSLKQMGTGMSGT